MTGGMNLRLVPHPDGETALLASGSAQDAPVPPLPAQVPPEELRAALEAVERSGKVPSRLYRAEEHAFRVGFIYWSFRDESYSLSADGEEWLKENPG